MFFVDFCPLQLCAKTGFWPDCISTDLHKESCEAPCYDLTIAMSKMLHLGMPLMEVVRAVTATPAKVIGWEGKIGHLAVGAVADITVLRRSESPLWLEVLRLALVIAMLVGLSRSNAVGEEHTQP